MNGVRPAANDVDVDLGRLFGSLARNWLQILVVALVVTALALVLALTAEEKYRAETRILIESRESVFTQPNSVSPEAGQPLLDQEAITSQVEIIRSADILRDVTRELQLGELPEFNSEAEISALGQFLILLGLRTDPSQASIEDRVIRTLRENLNVYRVENSRVIVIQYSSTDPELAARIPNAVADAYIEAQQQAKLASNSNATDWLEPEIAELRQRVQEAEGRVAEYRAQHDLMLGHNNTILAQQQLSELSSELSRMRANRSAAEGRADAIRQALETGASLGTIPDVLASAIVQRLREQQVQIRAEIAELSTTLLSNHPRMRALNAQLAELDEQVRQEAVKVLEGVENEAATARQREQELVASLNRLKAEAARANDDEVELRALEREAASQRALLESYLARYREAASRAEGDYLPVDARIFSRATAPFEPYFPKVVPIVAAAFVVALLVMAIVTLLRELFSGRAMRAAPGAYVEPVDQVTMPEPRAETIEPAAVGASDEAAATMAAAGELEPVARPEISVEDAAERLIAAGAARAIFVSPEGDEASATSVMVSREISDAGLRVLFLDLTSSGAPSSSMLESARFPGITNLLASEAQFSEIIRGDLYSDCHVIPIGTADPRQAMRAIDRLPIIMSSLTTAYDLVVVECGPANAEGIARVFDADAEILLSVIEPEGGEIEATAEDLAARGYEKLIRVTPVGYTPPRAPGGRSVA